MNMKHLGQKEQDWNPWRAKRTKIGMLMLKAGLGTRNMGQVPLRWKY